MLVHCVLSTAAFSYSSSSDLQLLMDFWLHGRWAPQSPCYSRADCSCSRDLWLESLEYILCSSLQEQLAKPTLTPWKPASAAKHGVQAGALAAGMCPSNISSQGAWGNMAIPYIEKWEGWLGLGAMWQLWSGNDKIVLLGLEIKFFGTIHTELMVMEA